MKKILLLPQQIIPGYFTSASYIRLIHPFQSLAQIDGSFDITISETYQGGRYDAVIIERTYRDNFSTEELYHFVRMLKSQDTKLIYTADDNFQDYFIEGDTDEKNLRQLSIVCLLARSADAVICSTEMLSEIFGHFNQNVYVFHNYISKRLLSDTEKKPSHKENRDRVNIGYMGTLIHFSDFLVAANAMKEIMFEQGNVDLHFVGVGNPDGLREAMKPYEVSVHVPPDSKYEPFFRWFTSEMRWDICLAPLEDTSLNRSKSDLKLLDYSAIGGAGIYSNLTPYEHLESEGLGLVVENTDDAWYSALSKLIDDPDLRRDIQTKSYTYLREHRLLEDNVYRLGKIMDSILL